MSAICMNTQCVHPWQQPDQGSASWPAPDQQGASRSDEELDIRDPEPSPAPALGPAPDSAGSGAPGDAAPPVQNSAVKPPASSAGAGNAPHGFADDWHTIRYSNTTNEPLKMHVTVADGQSQPTGVDANGDVTIPPGGFVDLTYAPGTSANFRSTKGDGSVWNQGEVNFDEGKGVIWGNMSYIYGANSNMRMYSEDGQHSGYEGDLFANAPSNARVGDWGIMAPYDRFHHSNDPNNPDSAAGGPDGPKNAGAAYLYSQLDQGEGYVGRGRPAEVSDYDDASSLQFGGKVAVVF